ncbi:MAG: AAA family ATPase [Clostridia bacterium]|nr:AAA family ATPase [Clostridia bacterium]
MVWLQEFRLPEQSEEESFLMFSLKAKMTVWSSYYPFGLFPARNFPTLTFGEITVFYGDNGSGKSTLLNLISEKIGLNRETPYNRTDFFDDYVALCKEKVRGRIPDGSSVLASDDVFASVMGTRRQNERIDAQRSELLAEQAEEKSKMFSGEQNRLNGMGDYGRWKQAHEARTRTRSAYLRGRALPENLPERSNGESALVYFAEAIEDEKLYLLDEPENSLSPANQRLLAGLIDEAAHHRGCQFVLSTHSPFLLSLRGAHVWDLDAVPPAVTPWTKLENVRVYREFFKETDPLFK